MITILKGNIVHTPTMAGFDCHRQSYLIAEDGIIKGIYPALPDEYQGHPVQSYGSALIIPGLNDIHVHAPQYVYRGMGIDLQLMQWLETYAFPTEARFSNTEYARIMYHAFADDLAKNGTTRAVVFGTIHVPATEILMEELENHHIGAYVGKVNMDTASPEYLCETPEQSLEDTERWIQETKDRFHLVKPAITPRFIPTCSTAVLQGLGKLAEKYDLPIQSHLSEDIGEMEVSRGRYPEYDNDGDVYDHFGLFTDRTVMAHFLWPKEHEMELVKERGVTIACCAQSHGNVAEGMAKTRKMLDMGIKVGLGSDIAGGCSVSILRAMSDAIYMSKIRYLESEKEEAFLTAAEAFYMGTMGGGQFFGKVGCFKPGYVMDAVVLDDSSLALPTEQLTLQQRVERAIHLADDRNIKARYVEGVKC